MICNNDGEPLLFASQKDALRFWIDYKDRFVIPVNFNRTSFKASPNVVREDDPDDVLFGKLESGEYEIIRPEVGFLIYPDENHLAKWLIN